MLLELYSFISASVDIFLKFRHLQPEISIKNGKITSVPSECQAKHVNKWLTSGHWMIKTSLGINLGFYLKAPLYFLIHCLACIEQNGSADFKFPA